MAIILFWSLSPLKRGVVCSIQNGNKSIFTTTNAHYYANVTLSLNFQGRKNFFLIFAGSITHVDVKKRSILFKQITKSGFRGKG